MSFIAYLSIEYGTYTIDECAHMRETERIYEHSTDMLFRTSQINFCEPHNVQNAVRSSFSR